MIVVSKTVHRRFTTAVAKCPASFMKTGDLQRQTQVDATVAMNLSALQQVREVEGTSLLCLLATPGRRSRICFSHLDPRDHLHKIPITGDSINQQTRCRLPDRGVPTTPPSLMFSRCLGQASDHIHSRSHPRPLPHRGLRHRNHPVFTQAAWSRSSAVGHQVLPYKPPCHMRQVGLAVSVEDHRTPCLRQLVEGLQRDPLQLNEAPEAAIIHWVRLTVF
jgi:hypothetical protein